MQSKMDRTVNILDASATPTESLVMRVGSLGMNTEAILNRIRNLKHIRHASQAAVVFGDLTTTTLYSSHINTCIGLVVVCPETKHAAIVHISDFFVGILASEKKWGQKYMQNMLRTIFEKIDPGEVGTREVMLLGGTDLNVEDQIYEKLFLALGLYTSLRNGNSFFEDFANRNMHAILDREQIKESIKELQNSDDTNDVRKLRMQERRLNEISKSVNWPAANDECVRQFKRLTKDEFTSVVNNISDMISDPVMSGARRMTTVGVLWVKNVLTKDAQGRNMSKEAVRNRYYPPGVFTDEFRSFQSAQIEGVHVLFDYLDNLQTSLEFNRLQHSNIQERVDGQALSVVVHYHNTKPEILIWREDVYGTPQLFIPSRRQAYPVRDYTLGHNEPTLRRRGVFMMSDLHQGQLYEDDMIRINRQDAILKKYE